MLADNYITLPSKINQPCGVEVGSKQWIKDYTASLLKRIVDLELLMQQYPEGKKVFKVKLEAYYKELIEWKTRKANQRKQINKLLKHK